MTYAEAADDSLPLGPALDAIHQLLGRMSSRKRIILGITGAPGAGKSTLAAQLCEYLGPEVAVVVPMDGFHLANNVLHAESLGDRKGAIETFDIGGYLALLQRLATVVEPIVYAPDFVRTLDEPVAASIAVPAHIPLVITEGNYLLADRPGWQAVRNLVDEVWFIDSPDALRRARLSERHILYGKDQRSAEEWTNGNDQVNAELVETTRAAADRVIQWGGSDQRKSGTRP